VKVTAEKVPESRVLLRIEVPPDQVEQAIQKAYQDISKRVRIPGFRPGRAPRPLVERFLGGSQVIEHEGIERLVDESYRRALRDTDTHPIGDADISEHPEYHPGEPLVFEATVPVSPTVSLGDYESIRMQPVQVGVTPQQVNTFIDSLQTANAEWAAVERPIQALDHAVIDVLGIAGSVPTLYGPGGETILRTEGGREVYNVTAHDHEVNPEGPVEFAPGFDEELVGLTPGSEKTFGLTLPTDYPDPDLANQSIVFTVKVSEVKEKHLPELNDEFATKVGAESMEQLRQTVQDRLQARMEQEAQSLFENALVEAVVERSTIEIPDVMVERQIDAQMSDLKADLARERINWADYLMLSKQTEEQVRIALRESALKTLRAYLVLRDVARKEGIQVQPEEVDAEIEATASQFGAAANVVRERLSTRDQRERIESRLFYNHSVARLTEIAAQPRPEAGEGAEESPEAAPTEAPALSQESTELATAVTAPHADDADTAVPTEATGSAAEVPTNEETETHG